MSDSTVEVGGGRTLGYREYGDPDGDPVVSCHGGMVCGLDVAAWSDDAAAANVRIISPDRPGLRSSDPSPGRTTGDWGDDVGALLDGLGLSTVAVLGWSMGGQYALACAARLPARVTRAVVVAGAVHLDDDAFSRLNAMDRRLTRLSQHHPHVARSVFKTLAEVAAHEPEVWAHLTERGAVPEEASTIGSLPDPGLAAAAAGALHDTEGMVEEYRAWIRPWGFAPEDVQVPTVVWQGHADELVPPEWARELADRIPVARLVMREGEGHFLGYRHRPEILRDLRDPAVTP